MNTIIPIYVYCMEKSIEIISYVVRLFNIIRQHVNDILWLGLLL